MKVIFPCLVTLCLLTACTTTWSPYAADGTPLSVAEPQCRANAQEFARHQFRFGSDYMPGPAGFPPDTPRDVESREIAACLRNRGFTMTME